MRALVTGGSHGLGQAIVDRLVEVGWSVETTTHRKDALPENVRWKYYQFDPMENPVDSCETLSLTCVGPFDLVINNAGVNAIRPFEDLDHEFIQEIMNVNFMAPVLLVNRLMYHGKMSTPASVINITSDAAWRPMRHSLAYNCSKAALDMATRQMARELTKPYNMSILSVRPGKMKGTAMSAYIDESVQKLRGWTMSEAMEYWRVNSLTGVEFDPQGVARLIVHLVRSGMLPAMSGTCVDLAG